MWSHLQPGSTSKRVYLYFLCSLLTDVVFGRIQNRKHTFNYMYMHLHTSSCENTAFKWTWHMTPRIFLPPKLPANIPPCHSTCPSPLHSDHSPPSIASLDQSPFSIHAVPPHPEPYHMLSIHSTFRFLFVI